MLSAPAYVDAPASLIRRALVETDSFALTFHGEHAGYPRRDHALWLLSQMRRWGQIGEGVEVQAAAAQVYRPDLYLQAAKAVGAASAGFGARPLEPMFDGRFFDPARLEAYVADFPIRRVPAP
jgi:hypothetical protein